MTTADDRLLAALDDLKIPRDRWAELRSPLRSPETVRLRAILVLFLREHPRAVPGLSWPEIAEIVGYRSYSGAMASYAWIRTLVAEAPSRRPKPTKPPTPSQGVPHV